MNINQNLHKTPLFSDSGEIFLGTRSVISAKTDVRTCPYSFAKHIHKSVELYLIDSGSCGMDIGSRKLTFFPGDLVMVYPDVVHSFYLEESGSCVFRHIHFDPELFFKWHVSPNHSRPADILTVLTAPFGHYLHLRADEKISSLVDGIIEESNENDALSDAMANLQIAELLLYLIRLTRPEQTYEQETGSRIPNHLQYVSDTLAYIHENYDQKILIPDIAARLNISARYLNKIFFQHMSLTILTYINMYRVNQAIELMRDTDLSLTEIAAQTGCKDSQHFSKLFKNIIGLPPNQYRKRIIHETANGRCNAQ